MLLLFGVRVHHSTVGLGDLLQKLLELDVVTFLLALLMMVLLARALLLNLRCTFILCSLCSSPSLVAIVLLLLFDIGSEGVGGVVPRLILVV